MSYIDLLFIALVFGLAFWGYLTGVVGAAIWLVAAYISIMFGAQFVGRVVPYFGFPAIAVSLVAPVGYIIFSAGVFLLARMASTTLRLAINMTPLKWVNDIGGALVGALLGTSISLAAIALLAVFTYAIPLDALTIGGTSYAESFALLHLDSEPRRWLDEQLTASVTIDVLSNLRPLIVPFAPERIGVAVDVLFSRLR